MLLNELLVVESVDLFPYMNAQSHHTENFELVHVDPPTAILRRGQSFVLAIRFTSRSYESSKDLIRLLFTFGPHPSTLKGTEGAVTISGKKTNNDDLEQWDVKLIEKDQVSLTVEVRSPPDAPVGQWQLQVETKLKDDPEGRKLTYKYPNDIYLLFNPWQKNDQVYMEDTLLAEYVLNDVGKIWVGPYPSRGREWVFGQFDPVVLPAAMLMIERANMSPSNRGNPILLTRAISKMVNSNDDLGVLQGRWDGDYEDGTAPAAWTGSVPILDEYLKTGKEVLYGQCWVFAGVVTTVCRALGIPSRVVSNLVSAHDANNSLTIDRYISKDNETLEYDPNNPFGEDSIWNYHVWNDVWMARPDLPKGYGGWQAVDGTPQETSDSVYQCGPASLEAIKNGAVGFNYDVGFLLASVNADLMRWKEDDTCDMGFSIVDCNKYHIGRIILTKAPWIFDPNGDRDREDITLQYKPKEGTKAERLTLMNGVQGTERAKKFYRLPTVSKVDIEFQLVDLETVNIGDDFSVTVNIHNKSNELRNVQAVLSAESLYYTGVKAKPVKKASGDFKVQPNNKEVLRLKVTADEYLDKLVEYCNMKICAIATVTDTNYTWADEDDFQVIKPPLDVKVPKEVPQKQYATAVCTFKNPLKKMLTKCRFRFEGPGIKKSKPIPYRDVNPQEEVKLEHRFMPQKSGSLTLIGTFYSKELLDITGSAKMEVYED
ncbi:hemocyte protein-glutamine gamma-glutamyltransferase [Anabrus simplex]|uniref:hemocyte protein-glutamine gamma-glutamyltransferase n=1 Tax=Anabrus simplex TaxID=316456 RepID=UPI0035A2EA34